ncbi:uncharacterized protein LOC144924851 [Branchiostoma floridae x Branchiostoma belcheri]
MAGRSDDGELETLFQNGDPEDRRKDLNWRLWIKNYLGVTACLASGIFTGLVPATFRYVQDRGYTAFQLNFFSDLLLISVVLCVAVYNKTNLIPTSYNQALCLVFEGVGRFFALLCLFSAYRYLPPANADTVINPGKIVFVAILSCLCLQEIPTPVTMFGSLWCIAGVALIGYSGMTKEVPATTVDSENVALGMTLAIVAGLITSMLTVNIKGLLSSGTTRTMILTYAYSISTVLAGAATTFTSKTWILEPTAAAVLCAGLLGQFGGTVLLYVGLKLVEVNAATALRQVDVFSAFGLQWALLGFAPTIFDGFGLTCIFIGTFSIVIWEARVSRKKEKHVRFMEELEFIPTHPDDVS